MRNDRCIVIINDRNNTLMMAVMTMCISHTAGINTLDTCIRIRVTIRSRINTDLHTHIEKVL